MEAKRVILRLRDNDFPDISHKDIVKCVETFLTFSGRSAEELAQGRHMFHFQPPNHDLSQDNPRFHIIIDMEKTKHSGPLGEDFPHEIYRVSRRDYNIQIIPFKNRKEHDNFVQKLRYFSDSFYHWGVQGRENASGC